MHVAVLDVHTIEEVDDVAIPNIGADDFIEILARRGPEHRLVVVADDVSDQAIRMRSERLERAEHVAVTFDNTAQLLERDVLGDHRQIVTAIICLQKIEEVAIDNELDFSITKLTSAVVIQKFDELFAEVELFKRVGGASLKSAAAAEMQI